eukprot:367775-Amphidinium_carterae.1
MQITHTHTGRPGQGVKATPLRDYRHSDAKFAKKLPYLVEVLLKCVVGHRMDQRIKDEQTSPSQTPPPKKTQPFAAFISDVLRYCNAVVGCKMGGSWSTTREQHLEAVQRNGWHLRDVPECYRADREIVLAAVKQDGRALEFAAEECKADREIVLPAVQGYGYNGAALQFAAEECKADREIVLAAVKQDGYALRFAAEECKRDRQIVLVAVENSPCFEEDRLRMGGSALRYAAEECKADHEI